jgi:predicted dehydrogenase
MAEIDNTLTSIAPDDTGIAIYRWGAEQNGAMGVLFNSSITLAGENTCEIYGDEGVIIQNYDDGVSTPHAPAGVAPLKLFRKSMGQWEHFEYSLPGSHYERLKAVPRPWIDNLKKRRTARRFGARWKAQRGDVHRRLRERARRSPNRIELNRRGRGEAQRNVEMRNGEPFTTNTRDSCELLSLQNLCVPPRPLRLI